ncbi:MAG: hypothetical protein H6766_04970 [Candidatus Peribacteria bacterium]|nr:MAG: hypothetical protein H6766_04970 [Candidatus Peribacteria bacterium]
MMKIGVVSIGNDSLELFRFLHRYDHEYVVYYDADARPLGDKTRARQLEIVQVGYDCLVAEGCDYILLPPVGEIGRERARKSEKERERVLPLYKNYVMTAFGKSLVGKIGYLAESGQLVQQEQSTQSINMMQI